MRDAWNPGDQLLLARVKEWQKKIEEDTGYRGLLRIHMSESVYAGLMGLTVQEAHDQLVDRSDAKPLEQDGWWAIEVHTVADC